MNDGDESARGSGHYELDCASVMGEVWSFLDEECTDETYAKLCRHLATCQTCMDQYALQGRVKKLIATKCGGDHAPLWLRPW
jgi:mycothiol system anti-sigma-R factor